MRKLKKYKPTRFMAKTSHYDKDAADYAVMFIESLCHTKGTWAGKPFELIDWQEQIIRDLFGVLKPTATGSSIQLTSRYRRNRANRSLPPLWRSCSCAGTARNVRVYGCAADRNQAKIVFDVAVDMYGSARRSPSA